MSKRQLDAATYLFDVPASALTEEFTWDDWTQLRHAYLRVRHAWRYHDDWETASGFTAHACSDLITAVTTVMADAGPAEVDVNYPHVEVHTLMADTLDSMLLGCVSSGVRRTIEYWESGLLPLLILRRLEIEALDRLNLTERINRPPLDDNTEIRFGVESWVPIGTRVAVMEGRLEDMAYLEIAHDGDAVVSVESLDGTEVYFAASLGLVIGQNLLASPPTGETVRLRMWRSFNFWSSGASSNDVDSANHTWAEYSIEDLPEGDVMTRTELLVEGGPEASTDWRVWTWDDLVDVAGWALPPLPDDEEPPRRKRRSPQPQATPPVHILRTEPEEWVRERAFGSNGHLLLGEQTEWAFNRPALYRIIAGEYPGMSFQRAPRPGESFTEGACAYWSAALELLVYNLGWSSPSLGVEWWLRSGRPTNDRILTTLDEIWFRDGQFDALRGWLAIGWSGACPSTDLVEPRTVDPAMISAAMSDEIRSHLLNDNFHLNGHSSGPEADRDRAMPNEMQIRHDDVTVLVLSGLRGWHSAVSRCEPDTAVHLYVPWIGRIGVFTKSPHTGIWHATTEEIHLAGNSLR